METPPRRALISEKTGIALGMVLVLAGGVWWAATMNAKLDQVLRSQQENAVLVSVQGKQIAELEARVRVLEAQRP